MGLPKSNPLIPMDLQDQEALHQALQRPRTPSVRELADQAVREHRIHQAARAVLTENPDLNPTQLTQAILAKDPSLAPANPARRFDTELSALLAAWGWKPKQQQQTPPGPETGQRVAKGGGEPLPDWEKDSTHRRLPRGVKGLPCVAGAPNPNLPPLGFSLDGDAAPITPERAEELAAEISRRFR
jgi:hypothetical protein